MELRRAGSSVKSMSSSPEDPQWAASTFFGFQDSLLSWTVTSARFSLCPPLTHSVCSWAAFSRLTLLSSLSFIYSLAYHGPSYFSTHSQAAPRSASTVISHSHVYWSPNCLLGCTCVSSNTQCGGGDGVPVTSPFTTASMENKVQTQPRPPAPHLAPSPGFSSEKVTISPLSSLHYLHASHIMNFALVPSLLGTHLPPAPFF